MKIITAISLLLLSTIVYSQNSRDIIHLKNHSVIKGEIIEKSDSLVRIATIGENIFAFSPIEIDYIDKEDLPTKKTSGYVNFTSMGLLIGSSSNQKPTPFSLLSEHNYQFNQYIFGGAVVGVELLNEITVPIGANLKLSKPLTDGALIYVGTSSGYSISLEKPTADQENIKEANGGFFFNTEVGLTLPSNNNTKFFFAIGYRYNTLKYLRESWIIDEIERTMFYNRLSIKLGIMLL